MVLSLYVSVFFPPTAHRGWLISIVAILPSLSWSSWSSSSWLRKHSTRTTMLTTMIDQRWWNAHVAKSHQMARQRWCDRHPTGLVRGPRHGLLLHQPGFRHESTQLESPDVTRFSDHRSDSGDVCRHVLFAAGALASEHDSQSRR